MMMISFRQYITQHAMKGFPLTLVAEYLASSDAQELKTEWDRKPDKNEYHYTAEFPDGWYPSKFLTLSHPDFTHLHTVCCGCDVCVDERNKQTKEK